MNRKRGSARVKYLGFGNEEEKELDDLFMSKGEERREEQERMGEQGGIREEDIHNLIAKNCPDLLASFGDEKGGAAEGLDLEKLTLKTKSKKTAKKKEASSERSLHESLKSEFSERQIDVEGLNGSTNKPVKVKKEKKEKTSKKSSKHPTIPNSLPASWDQPTSMPNLQGFQNPMMYPQSSQMGPMMSPMGQMGPMMGPMGSMGHMMSPMGPMYPPMASTAPPFTPLLNPPLGTPPPPLLEGMDMDQVLLNFIKSIYATQRPVWRNSISAGSNIPQTTWSFLVILMQCAIFFIWGSFLLKMDGKCAFLEWTNW